MLENGWGPKLMKIWCEAFRLGPLVKNFGIFVLVKKKARMPSRNTGNFSRTFSPAKLVAALPLVQPPQSFPPAGKLLWEGAKGVVVSISAAAFVSVSRSLLQAKAQKELASLSQNNLGFLLDPPKLFFNLISRNLNFWGRVTTVNEGPSCSHQALTVEGTPLFCS